MKPPFTYFGGKMSQVEIGAHAGNAHDRRRTEVLWSNRPFPAAQAELFGEAAETCAAP